MRRRGSVLIRSVAVRANAGSHFSASYQCMRVLLIVCCVVPGMDSRVRMLTSVPLGSTIVIHFRKFVQIASPGGSAHVYVLPRIHIAANVCVNRPPVIFLPEGRVLIAMSALTWRRATRLRLALISREATFVQHARKCECGCMWIDVCVCVSDPATMVQGRQHVSISTSV